ncbi:MAG TPA: hypothetical protein H9671_10995 [Firmicutes bacterium]|nr:hypothetical protein [Bacillota bacterium]
MSSLDLIKTKIKTLYETNPQIHVNISISHPKLNLQNDPATITGVYRNVFRIEEYSSGSPKYHTLQYTDIFTKQIEIVELKNDQ